MSKQPYSSIVQWLQVTWLNCSFRKKLAFVLVAAAVVPSGVVAFCQIDLTEQQLLEKVQRSVTKEVGFFQQQQQQIEDNHRLLANGLAKGIEIAKIDLNNSETIQQRQSLDTLMQSSETNFTPSFYLLTDAQGRTVAQKIQILADSRTQNEALPIYNQSFTAQTYRSISVPVGIDLSKFAIVQAALQHQRSLSGHEILSAELLQQLGLAEQANIGIRPQQTGLPDAMKPLPDGTYPLEQGKIGLAAVAVKPIKQNNRLVGTAIVGTLLNRNTALIDPLLQKTGSSSATIFAYDWRISTNVPSSYENRRALGTRVAREVAEIVLQQGKLFTGTTTVINQPYMAAYAPLYDHQAQLSPTQAKPIGLLATAKPMTEVDKMIDQLLFMSYGISGGILVIIGLLAFPLTNILAGSLQRLTQFAQQVGCSEGDIDTSLLMQFQNRRDEIGILAQELSQMTQRIETNLTTVQRSEAQLREQTLQLQDTLEKLQQTQLQLIQTEKMSGLGQLTAGIAHEINNPVSFIHGNLSHASAYIEDLLHVLHLYQQEHLYPSAQLTEALADTDLAFVEVDLPKLLQSMEAGTQRIRDIVLSLRNFSRLDEAGKKVVDLHEGIESTLLILRHRLQSQSTSQPIQVMKQYGELPLVECHPGLINQVLMNLLANAIDALEADQIEAPMITITTQLETANKVEIRIADNGIGMSEAAQAKLFSPFYTTKPVGKGTGLGLSISYQIIVEKHAGQIKCSSKLGAGTEFWIQLPIAAPASRELELCSDR